MYTAASLTVAQNIPRVHQQNGQLCLQKTNQQQKKIPEIQMNIKDKNPISSVLYPRTEEGQNSRVGWPDSMPRQDFASQCLLLFPTILLWAHCVQSSMSGSTLSDMKVACFQSKCYSFLCKKVRFVFFSQIFPFLMEHYCVEKKHLDSLQFLWSLGIRFTIPAFGEQKPEELIASLSHKTLIPGYSNKINLQFPFL